MKTLPDGDGDGYGYGDGDGDGYGCGYGYGNGNGYGDGNGYGYGNGDGNGYGNGDGYGDGDGDGYGDGNVCGYGRYPHTALIWEDAIEIEKDRFMKHPYIPQGCDQQGRHTPSREAMLSANGEALDRHHDACMWGRPGFASESCTELGAEPVGRPRMGLMHGWERAALGFSKRPWGLFWVAVGAAVVGYFVRVM